MKQDTIDTLLFTPPTSTFLLHAVGEDPILRDANGAGWFGRRGLPAHWKDEVRRDNLIWQRTGEACVALRSLRKPWAVVSVKHDDISPVELPVFAKLLELPDVEHIIFSPRAMCFSVVVYGWSYNVGDYQDMEDCLCRLGATTDEDAHTSRS